jgi:hypothetical protein
MANAIVLPVCAGVVGPPLYCREAGSTLAVSSTRWGKIRAEWKAAATTIITATPTTKPGDA